ncbi:MAG: hypothetical protein QOD53_2093 [Thermoleophilaceae bacterium]|nr:hypothetical protein [Thermoleophilaceae bacterium]
MLLALALVILAIAAAPGPAVAAHIDSGVRGDVKTSPTCPVERVPPDPACAPRGYATTVRIRKAATGRLVKKVQSSGDGRFKARLRPGRYSVQPESGSGGLPRCDPQEVRVKAHRFAKLHLGCDSGIR